MQQVIVRPNQGTILSHTLGPLRINSGLTNHQIQQLIQYSNTDQAIKKYSSDQDRFKNRAAYNHWFAQGKSIYSMQNEQNKLLGLVWFGSSSLPRIKLKATYSHLPTGHYQLTFALRVYDQARGRGLAKKLTAMSLTIYLNSEIYRQMEPNGIWLETFKHNLAAVKTYSPFFKQISLPDKEGKIVMILAID